MATKFQFCFTPITTYLVYFLIDDATLKLDINNSVMRSSYILLYVIYVLMTNIIYKNQAFTDYTYHKVILLEYSWCINLIILTWRRIMVNCVSTIWSFRNSRWNRIVRLMSKFNGMYQQPVSCTTIYSQHIKTRSLELSRSNFF